MAKQPIILTEQIIPPPALVRAGLEALPAIIRPQLQHPHGLRARLSSSSTGATSVGSKLGDIEAITVAAYIDRENGSHFSVELRLPSGTILLLPCYRLCCLPDGKEGWVNNAAGRKGDYSRRAIRISASSSLDDLSAVKERPIARL